MTCREKYAVMGLQEDWDDGENAAGDQAQILAGVNEENKKLKLEAKKLQKDLTAVQAQLKLVKGDKVATANLETEREKFQDAANKASTLATARKREIARLKTELAEQFQQLSTTRVSL